MKQAASWKYALRHILWLLGILTLFALGIVIVIEPKWHNEFIHISLSNGHGITTQDVIALLPISLGLLWLGAGIWHDRDTLRQYARQFPETAAITALGIGVTIGSIFGLFLGVIFEDKFMSLLRAVSNPIESLFR